MSKLIRMSLSVFDGVPPEHAVSVDRRAGTFIIDSAHIVKADVKPMPRDTPATTPIVVKDPRGLWPCVHRQNRVGDTKCGGCGVPQFVEVFACDKHVSCTIKRPALDKRIAHCMECHDRSTGGTLLDFCDFNNKHAGRTGYIVGRGRTTFANEDLAKLDGPIFFINDAALLEEHCPDNPDTFMFAQDKRIAAVLPGLRSKIVIAKGSEIGFEVSHNAMPRLGSIVWTIRPNHGEERLLRLTRDQLALERRLYRAAREEINGTGRGPSPTICQALHFAWYVGCETVKLIRCDGLAEGYAKDIENRSNSPEVSVGKYVRARHDAEHVMKALGMQFEFLGTPTLE